MRLQRKNGCHAAGHFWVICMCVCVTNDEIDGADDASVHRTVNVFRTKRPEQCGHIQTVDVF